MGDQYAIEIHDAHKAFGDLEVLRGVDLNVGRGEVVCIIGPSGSGKSTLLRCINHLEGVDAGDVIVNGALMGYRRRGNKLYELNERDICAQRSEVGMVFQHFNLFRHLSVRENLVIGPRLVRGTARAEADQLALQMLERVGLADKVNAYPSQLSGGQQQRIAIARALCMKPSAILFDEPTSALDPELVGEVLAVMRDLADDGMTMVVVTHEIGFARDIADTLVVMDAGTIIESGPPSQVLTDPQHERTQRFLSSVH